MTKFERANLEIRCEEHGCQLKAETRPYDHRIYATADGDFTFEVEDFYCPKGETGPEFQRGCLESWTVSLQP